MGFSTQTLMAIALAITLSACGGSPTGPVNPADIKPVYTLRNSPFKVPSPRIKPKVPVSRYAAPPQEKAPAYLAQASGKTVTVRKGDTLYALSRRYGVSVVDLSRVNNIRPPYGLTIGQKIKLPSVAVHVVKKGETTYGIAQTYSVLLSDLVKVNKIRPPYGLAIGQRLTIPGGAKVAASVPASYAPKKTTAQKPASSRVYVPPPKSGQYFAWPVTGTIISRFGPKQGGVHNDGINLLAKRGLAVRAAETGVVAYAADDLPGYGNLILVKHSGNWVTAYAHTENVKVKPGQVVTKGQILAHVGASGGVLKPQLHFEIRRGRKALNPLLYLERVKTAMAQ